MDPVKAELVPFGEGHLLVSEAGVFALAEEAAKAEALGREAYARLALPVVPLVVGSYREGYHQGVLHVASLEGHLKSLPRVLSPEAVERLAAFLKGEGERPEVRLQLPEAPSSEGRKAGEASPGKAPQVASPAEAPPALAWRRVAREEAPTLRVAVPLPPAGPPASRPPLLPRAALLALGLPLVLYPALVGAIPGLLVLLPALHLLLTQERLLARGGAAREYVGAFKGVLFGLALAVLLGGGLHDVLPSLAGGLAYALLPGLYGVAASLWPLPLGRAARLYAQAMGDALGPAALLAPLALLYHPPLGLALLWLGALSLLGGHLGRE
jgi:hypothetical protein